MSISSEITRINNNIASAYSKVEEKGGTLPETQNSANLATAIDSISGGGLPDWSQIGYEGVPSSLLVYFDYSKEILNNWDTSATDLYGKFMNNYDIRFMPLVDTSNATKTWYMFSGCSNLCTVPLLDTSKVTRMNNMFYACGRLIDLPILNTSEVTEMGGMFSNGGNNLSDESLNNLLRMCINATKIPTNQKTLKGVGLNSTLATKCTTLSNYQDFLNAGWTTGY